MRLSTLNPNGALAKWPTATVCDSRFGIVATKGRLERGSRLMPQGHIHPQGYSEAPSLNP